MLVTYTWNSLSPVHWASDTALKDEVREIRHRIAAECDNDLVKIA